MLTVTVRLLFAHYGVIFDYYGQLFDEANIKYKKAIDENDRNGMEYWRDICSRCILKRQKALNKRIWLRDYY